MGQHNLVPRIRLINKLQYFQYLVLGKIGVFKWNEVSNCSALLATVNFIKYSLITDKADTLGHNLSGLGGGQRFLGLLSGETKA